MKTNLEIINEVFGHKTYGTLETECLITPATVIKCMELAVAEYRMNFAKTTHAIVDNALEGLSIIQIRHIDKVRVIAEGSGKFRKFRECKVGDLMGDSSVIIFIGTEPECQDKLKRKICSECKKPMSNMEHNYGTEDILCCIHCYQLAQESL